MRAPGERTFRVFVRRLLLRPRRRQALKGGPSLPDLVRGFGTQRLEFRIDGGEFPREAPVLLCGPLILIVATFSS